MLFGGKAEHQDVLPLSPCCLYTSFAVRDEDQCPEAVEVPGDEPTSIQEKSDLLEVVHKNPAPGHRREWWVRLPEADLAFMGRALRNARGGLPTFSSNMIKGMKVLVDFKRSFIFLGEVIQTNSTEIKWWHMIPSHSQWPREWWECQGFFVYQYLSAFKALWADRSTQNPYDECGLFQLTESVKIVLSNR